jgi:NAD(P)-dependent dehydrogenase (short-subunit alcohol dehydrogenase family)
VKAASLDLAPHAIRVNAVSPAFIGPGAMWDNQVAQQALARSQYFAPDPEVVAQQMIEAIPLRRYGSAEEVADVIAFLAGDRSSYLTGVNIEIAGGAR